ncbi:MAG: hypothetical protein ACJAW3_000420 [Lentimonas sp.]|jgi:hypothetical protein
MFQKNLKYFQLLILLLVISCAGKNPPSAVYRIKNSSHQELTHKNYSHPLVKKSFKNAALFRKAQKQDLEKLHQEIIARKAKLNSKLFQKIRANLKRELQYLQNFNSLAQNLTFYDFDESVSEPTLEENYISPQVKHNKLDLFVKNALEFSDPELEEIISEKIITRIYPKNYLLPAADTRNNIRANLTIPSSIIVLLTTLKTIDETAFEEYIEKNLEKSSLFYSYQAPVRGNIDQNSIFNSQKKMIVVHNGYSFGGSIAVDEIRKVGFHTMPHDCSSYISHLIDLGNDPITKKSNVLWTSDAQNLANLTLNQNHLSIKDLRANIAIYGSFAQKMKIIEPQAITDFKEGDLLMFRKFDEATFSKKRKSNSLGKGGHIGVVLQAEGNQIYIISYIRNYEKSGTGGLLISKVSFKNLQNKNYSSYLFRLNQNN